MPPPLDQDSDNGNDDDSSSSAESIAARPPLRRQPLTGARPTLRPSRDPVSSNPSAAKRKRDADAPSNAPHPKRRRGSNVGVRDSIEVQDEEDDNVDAAINATRIRSTSNFVVELPSSRRPPKTREAPPPEAPPKRLRARRFKPGINSVEVFHESGPSNVQRRNHAHTVPESPPSAQPPRPAARGRGKGKGKAVQERSKSPDQRQGSPELQSSALKRRQRARRPDVYDFPDDEDEDENGPPSPLAALPPRPARGQARGPKKSRRARYFAEGKRLSLIHEEQNSGRSAPRSSSAPPVAPPVPAHRRTSGRVGTGRVRPDAFQEDEEAEEEEEDEEDGEVGEEEEHEADGEEEEEEDEDVEESDQSEEDEEAGVAQQSVAIQVLPYDPSHRPISVSSDHLDNMLGIVGRIGWTGAGRTWRATLLRLAAPVAGDRLRTRTTRGRILFESLSILMDQLEEVPNALDLVGQSEYLEMEQGVLNEAMSTVNDAVTTAEKSVAYAAARLASQPDSPFLMGFVSDLSVYVIPLLVLSLQAVFSIGIAAPDAESSEFLHAEGTFTSTTVQYLMWLSAWLSRLVALLPKPNPPPDTIDLYDPDNPAHNRNKFNAMLRKWRQHLEAGVREFNDNADRERDIAEKKRRDAAIRAERERQKLAQNAQGMDQQSAFLQWLRDARTQPRPLAEMFRRTVENWPRAAAAAPAAHQDWEQQQQQQQQQRSEWSSPARSQTGAGESRLLLAPPPPPSQPQPQPQQQPGRDYPPWPEDEIQWLLGEMARPDWGARQLEICAEVLERPVAEVRMEMERLAVLRVGRYR